MKAKDHSVFSWATLGDIKEGRGDLGEEMPVLVYRLMQYTMLDVLAKDMGKDKANDTCARRDTLQVRNLPGIRWI